MSLAIATANVLTTTANIIRNRFAPLQVVNTEIFTVYVPSIEPIEEEIIIPANFEQFMVEAFDSAYAADVAAIIDWENAIAQMDTHFWATADYPVFEFDGEFIFDMGY